jgi:hypothetical protein
MRNLVDEVKELAASGKLEEALSFKKEVNNSPPRTSAPACKLYISRSPLLS